HIATSDYHGEDRAKMLLSLKPRLEQLNSLIFLGENSKELAKAHSFVSSFESIMEAGGAPKTASPAKSNDVALILCTSGTTKGSKAVVFTHNNIIFSERSFNEYYGLTEEDSIFMPAPLNHATGLHHGIISPMLRGGRLVLQEKFCCREAIELMNREKCSYSMGATPFIYDILKQLEASGETLPSLKFYICGGAPVPPELVRNAYEKQNILVCESYGSTESVPHVGVKPEECLENAGLWSGKALPGIEIRIVDKNHKPVPPGVEGEEASRGPNLFIGYLGAPELTAEALDEEGWFYSGDLAVGDENGNIRIVGRIKDIIIRGGENLNSNHINDNLEGCPGVSDHAVIGMPDERLGERI
ncbi:MAG: AMP-binding protein, partial [Clostridia bacterium]